MKWKYVGTNVRLKLKPRGMIFTVPRDQMRSDKWTVTVKIAKWYFPWFVVKHLKRMGVPAYFWPYFLWKAYIGKARSHATADTN